MCVWGGGGGEKQALPENSWRIGGRKRMEIALVLVTGSCSMDR